MDAPILLFFSEPGGEPDLLALFFVVSACDCFLLCTFVGGAPSSSLSSSGKKLLSAGKMNRSF